MFSKQFVAYSDTGYDIIFMFDGTVNNRYFGWMQNFAHNFASQMDIDSGEFRVGAMTFNRGQNLVFNLNDNGWQSEVMQGLKSKTRNTPGGKPDLAGAFDYVRNNMFTNRRGDRPNARNFVIMMTANEESLNSGAAIGASQRLQNEGTGIFTIGFNLGNTDELDAVTTHPLDQYQYLINEESGLQELPGIIGYHFSNAAPVTLPPPTTPRPTGLH
ncbi:collagen alpha-3(VI) chain-like [Haliotis rubra]|uniref:collagen alpha-3(VI) chain-like n=1 Tax=Haliotis rubra TaxID=36100 RepID=UPI001EE5247F|nr:collagen alpha-3(VI) chain-like [Haliotis rubra]